MRGREGTKAFCFRLSEEVTSSTVFNELKSWFPSILWNFMRGELELNGCSDHQRGREERESDQGPKAAALIGRQGSDSNRHGERDNLSTHFGIWKWDEHVNKRSKMEPFLLFQDCKEGCSRASVQIQKWWKRRFRDSLPIGTFENILFEDIIHKHASSLVKFTNWLTRRYLSMEYTSRRMGGISWKLFFSVLFQEDGFHYEETSEKLRTWPWRVINSEYIFPNPSIVARLTSPLKISGQ